MLFTRSGRGDTILDGATLMMKRMLFTRSGRGDTILDGATLMMKRMLLILLLNYESIQPLYLAYFRIDVVC